MAPATTAKERVHGLMLSSLSYNAEPCDFPSPCKWSYGISILGASLKINITARTKPAILVAMLIEIYRLMVCLGTTTLSTTKIGMKMDGPD